MKSDRHPLLAILIAIVLTGALVLAMFDYNAPGLNLTATDLSEKYRTGDMTTISKIDPGFGQANRDFAFSLLEASYDQDDNLLLAPISIMMALAMTQNGAGGPTLDQMNQVLGGYDSTSLNENLKFYQDSIASDQTVALANSLWFKENALTISDDFVQTIVNYYEAHVYLAPFDNTTLSDINNWIEYYSDGMIEDALDEIPANALLYLVNTILFESRWQEEIPAAMVHPETFTNSLNKSATFDFLHSNESQYLEDDLATGFVKNYEDERYSFIALLPKGDIEEYVRVLDGARLSALLEDVTTTNVAVAWPKFEYEYQTQLNDLLSGLGMVDAFTPDADFSLISAPMANALFISRVLHATAITLNESGTKAAGATIVEMAETAAPIVDDQLLFDRPFVYLIYDNEMELPLFAGVLNQVEQ